ncbi:MAG: YccF domain-containing protein [Clostridia bacterium]|nr:YccF domain-containing protein [Clostridia bacterium]
MRIIGNILWLILGGLVLALGWALAGLLLCISIIGIPFGIECFKIAGFTLFPFGREIVYPAKAVGCGSVLFNILWLAVFGWELALGALVAGVLMCVTIVGIPFGLQSFKLAQLSLMPFGAEIR